jgi:hypothetical protein
MTLAIWRGQHCEENWKVLDSVTVPDALTFLLLNFRELPFLRHLLAPFFN